MIPKFRAWDKANEVMRDVLLIDFINRSVICETDDERNIKLYDTTYELMQSTGLKDKNGVEIFEGDIVKNKYNELGYIKWSRGGFVYHEDGANFYLFSIGAGQPFEVVGNKYEHPHLLEE